MTTEVNVIEGNKLIADFDDQMENDATDPKNESWNRNGKWVHLFDLCYNTSWDWLMPVVEKICKMRFPEAKPEDEDYDDTIYLRTFGALTEEGRFMVRFNRHVLFEAEELIEAAYPAVLDVIENLHNNNSTQTQ
jgi:hypothetical protein